MKGISAAVQTLMATGQYVSWDLYTFTVAAGTVVLNCHDADYNVTIGGTTYAGGLIFKRGAFKQSNDMSVQTLSLDVAPQYDYPGGTPTINGFAFVAAVRQGLLDGGLVNWNRLYLPIPTPANSLSWPDLVTYAPTPWFTGVITNTKTGRQNATLTISSLHELLNVQMPRNLVMSGCSHVLYDAGCDPAGTVKTANAFTGTVSAGGGVLSFNTSLTKPDGQFDLGRIVFTSGVNNGVSRTVRTYLNASGNVKLLLPLNSAPGTGDAFTIYSGCDKQQTTCTTKFSNLAHFRGMPYVPVPETLYDGTASAPAAGNLQPLGPPSGPGSGGRYAFKP